MPLLTSERDWLLDQEKQRCGFISLHTGDPGTTGTTECTSPGYSRQPVSWGAANSGIVTGAEVTFDVASGTYTHVGLWGTSSGSTQFRGGFNAGTSMTVAPAGKIKVTPVLGFTSLA